ncbi:hypothetical protein BXY70_2847 [Roseovarius halotolerans]|uniref:Uncharacterized protein n=1 Tax=Roseovarius halotolerans TaxID=505353 RepID=A0A1X6ZGH9_9RHOB|nr:hypothetical protein [Roseovarius halotolerans]RKT30851.1 hypothetical protein BXY70_2847 [Roseovarius halotolerans]SLN50517.1 hypothetical protein ROH8110_02743 [Roseovarius halotolerans]
MPKLIRLYITHVAIGFGIAAAFVAMLLWFDVANLWHLVSHSDKGLLAVVILWISNGIIFAGVQFGIAVMRLKDDDDDDHHGGLRQHVMRPDHATIPVRADEGAKNLFGKS